MFAYKDYRIQDRKIYEGNFFKNSIKGKGKLRLSNLIFEGNFNDNKIYENGIFKWSDEIFFEGNFENKKINGLYYNSKTEKLGEVKNNKFIKN